MWDKLGDSLNDAFYFVVDKIVALQSFFIQQAFTIGKVVLLIAILSAGLNYALTGTGLKENVIKILKATAFFFVIMTFYPRIIGFMTTWTWNMAYQSVYKKVESHFNTVVSTVEERNFILGQYEGKDDKGQDTYSARTFTRTLVSEIKRDNRGLLWGLTQNRSGYTTVQPASVLKIVFFIAGECFQFSEGGNKPKGIKGAFDSLSQFSLSKTIKGIICGFFIVFTGVFALLEYLVCFLEFMLVASVGIILFPLSIWEGSKFMAENYIGAILGFFMKMLFCNIAIFLLIFGFTSLFYVISSNPNSGGFTGEIDQIVFIIFVCLLFFYICKSAPGIAQSLLKGPPSLSATGAISAAAGAVAAVGAVGATAKAARQAAGAVAGGVATAKASSNTVQEAGGDRGQQTGAFFKSLGQSAADSFKAGTLGLTRRQTRENFEEGTARGREYAAQHQISRGPLPSTPTTSTVNSSHMASSRAPASQPTAASTPQPAPARPS